MLYVYASRLHRFLIQSRTALLHKRRHAPDFSFICPAIDVISSLLSGVLGVLVVSPYLSCLLYPTGSKVGLALARLFVFPESESYHVVPSAGFLLCLLIHFLRV